MMYIKYEQSHKFLIYVHLYIMSASTDFYFLRIVRNNLKCFTAVAGSTTTKEVGGSLSLHSVGFNSILVHVGFVVDQMVLGQVSLPVLQFPVNIILLTLHTNISLTYHRHHIILVTYCVIN